jgi:hypothetical protein
MELLELPPQETNLNAVWGIQGRLRWLSSKSPHPRLQRVAWLGDSTLIKEPGEPPVSLRLQERVRELTGNRPRVRVRTVAAPGQSAYEYYFLADSVVRSRPDQLLVLFQLSTLGEIWRQRFRRPEIAGWVSPRRLFEVLGLPVSEVGLTTDRLLLGMAIVGAGGGDAWIRLQKEQGRVDRARRDLGDWIAAQTGTLSLEELERIAGVQFAATYHTEDWRRWNERGARPHYQTAFSGASPDDPVLQMLAAALRIYREAGIHTHLYVGPANVEHFQRLGIYDEQGIAETLAVLRRIANEHGAEFSDLHALLPDRGFRDAGGHLAWGGDFDAQGEVIEVLAPRVAAQARRAVAGPR